MHERMIALLIGFALDLLLGDPHGWPHPVVLMGKAISALEKRLRARFPKTVKGERLAGILLAAVLPLGAFCVYALPLWACGLVHPWLRVALEGILCYQLLAARCLRDESMKVYYALKSGDLNAARLAVSMIVGRDTERLTEQGIVKAAVETVAENLSDGEVAPLIYFTLGGAPLMAAYKAINTLDSMVGYRNVWYEHFGRASAKLDDAVNYVPARVSGFLIIASAFLLRLDFKGAWRIFRRDRYNHTSPNSAQTEAACAGALGVRLAGDAVYGGKLVCKPFIGDDLRPIEKEDIRLANQMMLASSALAFALCLIALGGLA